MEHVVRPSQEVFQHHAEALGAEDIDSIVSDYAGDAIFITPEGMLRGKDGVREAFEKLTSEVPGAEWELPTQIYEDEILLLEWKATSAGSKVERDRHVRVSRRSDPRPERPLRAAANMRTARRNVGKVLKT